MTKRIFVTATNTDIGKTYTTKLLLKEFASRGLRVGVIKPIETGVIESAPDGDMLLELIQKLNKEFNNITREDIVPITYKLPSAPYIASNNTPLDFKLIDKSIAKIEKLCDILIIEGAGGLYVPIDDKTMMIDLIHYLKAQTLLVTHCSLGCINDTLLSSKALDSYNIKHTITFNCRENNSSFKTVSEPYFRESGFEVLRVNEDIKKICNILNPLINHYYPQYVSQT